MIDPRSFVVLRLLKLQPQESKVRPWEYCCTRRSHLLTLDSRLCWATSHRDMQHVLGLHVDHAVGGLPVSIADRITEPAVHHAISQLCCHTAAAAAAADGQVQWLGPCLSHAHATSMYHEDVSGSACGSACGPAGMTMLLCSQASRHAFHVPECTALADMMALLVTVR